MFLPKKIVDTKTIGRRNAKNSRTLFLLLLSLQKTRNGFLGVLLNSLRFFLCVLLNSLRFFLCVFLTFCVFVFCFWFLTFSLCQREFFTFFLLIFDFETHKLSFRFWETQLDRGPEPPQSGACKKPKAQRQAVEAKGLRASWVSQKRKDNLWDSK